MQTFCSTAELWLVLWQGVVCAHMQAWSQFLLYVYGHYTQKIFGGLVVRIKSRYVNAEVDL